MSVPQLRFKDEGGLEFPAWRQSHLGDICSITTGKLDANAMVENGQYRFYTCAKEHYRIDRYAFDTDALLISGNGANVGYIHHYKGKFNAYQRTYVLDGFGQDIIFVKYFLDAHLHARIFTEKKEGNTPYIVMGTLADMEIKFPSITEQTKIANFLTAVDEKITQLTQKSGLLTQYKKGVMQQIFSQVLRFKDDDGREFPEWSESTLGEICRPQQWTTISSSDLRETGFPVYGANGFIGYFDSYNHEHETVAVTCRGATCGEVSLIPAKSYITGNSMCLDDIDPLSYNYKFIYYAMKFRGFKDVISGSAQPQIVGSAIRKVEFMKPRLQEQTKIANFLSAIDDKIDHAQTQLAAARQYKQGLLQQMFV